VRSEPGAWDSGFGFLFWREEELVFFFCLALIANLTSRTMGCGFNTDGVAPFSGNNTHRMHACWTGGFYTILVIMKEYSSEPIYSCMHGCVSRMIDGFPNLNINSIAG